MPLSATKINKTKSTQQEQWIPVADRSGCYLVVAPRPRNSKRFVGKTRIGSASGNNYSVPLGIWGKDFNSPEEVLKKWDELKRWGKENNLDLRKYAERNALKKSETSLKEVCESFIQWKSGHTRSNTQTTNKNRLKRILLYLPDGMLVDNFSGNAGRRFLKERVLDPCIAKGNDYTAHRYRRLLNQVFNYAVDELFLEPELLPYRLEQPFPFEKNIKSEPHPHLPWDEFKQELIPDLNQNLCNASRLTDLSTKGVLMMLQRVSAVVSMQWNWYDDKTNCWVMPSETEGVKRRRDDDKHDHYIPNTPQLETLMNSLSAINGHQKYVFFSPYEGRHPYVSSQTPNDHLKNLGYQDRQDAHGFRHVATNALVDIGGFDREMVSRCLGHLKNEGVIKHYDFAKRLDQRREIHECWNQLLITEGLRI